MFLYFKNINKVIYIYKNKIWITHTNTDILFLDRRNVVS